MLSARALRNLIWINSCLVCLLTTVMLPARNRHEFEDIPAEARDKLQFVWLDSVQDAIACVLQAPTTEAAPV
jgi:ATP-dependent Lon protease